MICEAHGKGKKTLAAIAAAVKAAAAKRAAAVAAKAAKLKGAPAAKDAKAKGKAKAKAAAAGYSTLPDDPITCKVPPSTCGKRPRPPDDRVSLTWAGGKIQRSSTKKAWRVHQCERQGR